MPLPLLLNGLPGECEGWVVVQVDCKTNRNAARARNSNGAFRELKGRPEDEIWCVSVGAESGRSFRVGFARPPGPPE